MKNVTSSAQIEREITEILEQQETPHIMLYVPSMLNDTPEKIKAEIESFNQIMDYLIRNGKECVYITAEQNEPISYDELMILEDIVNESKREIQAKGAQTIPEKARVIEHVILHKFQTIVEWGDEDFYSSCDKNLIQALKAKRGSCCHFAALTQYLHLRNNMYSDIIYSNVNLEDVTSEKINHIFNLLFLDDEEKNWTFVDTMWEKDYLKIREQNRFSFVSLTDIQNDPADVDEAHKYIEKDVSNISTVTIDMGSIDRKLGYQNKLYLFPYSYFITYNISNGDFNKVQELFPNEDETLGNMENKNLMIQFIGLIAYISAIELGQSIKEKTPDESVMINSLDTYLKEILPNLYINFFKERIKISNTEASKDADSLKKYVTSLFQVITKEDGSVGIYFNDMLDRAYIGVDFTNSKENPVVNVLNRMQFEEKFEKIDDDRIILRESGELEYN